MPFLISATVKGTSSPQRGKFTKIRPVSVTVTPVGIAPLKVATTSGWPMARSAGNCARETAAGTDAANVVKGAATEAKLIASAIRVLRVLTFIISCLNRINGDITG